MHSNPPQLDECFLGRFESGAQLLLALLERFHQNLDWDAVLIGMAPETTYVTTHVLYVDVSMTSGVLCAAAAQAILDLCQQPGFCHEAYLNLDCRIERANLFEGVCALLSKTAFPVHASLSSVHLLSLNGLFSVLSALGARFGSALSLCHASQCDCPAPMLHAWAFPQILPCRAMSRFS